MSSPINVKRSLKLFPALLLLLLVAACTRAAPPAPTPRLEGDYAPRTLYDLGGLSTLQGRFNQDANQARLILLLSPT